MIPLPITGNGTADSLLQKLGALPPDEKAAIGMSHLPAIAENNFSAALAGPSGAASGSSSISAAPAVKRGLPLPNMPTAPPPLPNLPDQPVPLATQGAPAPIPTATGLIMPPAWQAKGIGPLPGSPWAAAQAKTDRLQSTPPGYAQIKNPFLRGLATAGNVASMFFPAEAMMIPGTSLHHDMLLDDARRAEAQFSGRQAAEDTERLRQAQAVAEAAKPEEAQAKLESAQAIHQATLDAKALEDEKKAHALTKYQVDKMAADMTKGGFRQNPVSGVWEAIPLGERPEKEQMAFLKDSARQETALADAALKRATLSGDAPAIKIAQQRLAIAQSHEKAWESQLGLGKPQEYIDPVTRQLKVLKPGDVLPEHATTLQGTNAINVQEAKTQAKTFASAKDARDSYALAQSAAGLHTGPGDLALVMQFMGAVKPETLGKMRFNKGEQDFILGTRSLAGGAEAWMNKIQSGELLPQEQRDQMLQVMKLIADRYPAEAPAPQSIAPPTGGGGGAQGIPKVQRFGRDKSGNIVPLP